MICLLIWHDRPFRKYDLKQGGKSWDSVDRLEKGCMYQEVCAVLLVLLITKLCSIWIYL